MSYTLFMSAVIAISRWQDVQLRPRGLVRVRHRGLVPRRRQRDRRDPEHLEQWSAVAKQAGPSKTGKGSTLNPSQNLSKIRTITLAGSLAVIRLKIRRCIARSLLLQSVLLPLLF